MPTMTDYFLDNVDTRLSSKNILHYRFNLPKLFSSGNAYHSVFLPRSVIISDSGCIS